MVIARLPERVRTPPVARAVVSPTAFLAAGLGMSAAILGGVPLIGAAVVGVLAWAGRVALAIPRKPAGDHVDPFAVGEPWRRFVQDALQAQARFDQTVRQARAGPIRDHLAEIGRRIGDGVGECWRIAKQGNTLEGALKTLNIDGIKQELAQVHAERTDSGTDSGTQASLAKTEEAIKAQLDSAVRIQRVSSDARNRVRLLNAQLDEAVARAVELSVQTGDPSALSPLGADVDNLVNELESLREGMEEAGGGTAATAVS